MQHTDDGGTISADVTDTMRANVLLEPRTIVMQERPTPTPRADEVLIRVAAVGVCGSDVHYYRSGRIGDFVVQAPIILGHEMSGRIVGVGADVPPERIGERVAVEPGIPCRRCSACKSGRYNLCPAMAFYATPPYDGAFCDYVTIPADFAFAVPDSMSDAAAGLLEPLSVGVWACRRAGVTAGSSVLITGAGPIGAMVAQVARAHGATTVLMSDPVATRRERATHFGATGVIDPTTQDVSATAGAVDAFIDCAGAEAAVQAGLRAVRPAGQVVLVGTGTDEIRLPMSILQTRELTVTGSFRYTDTWPTAIALVADGRVDLDGMVTSRFPLEQAEAALNADDDPTNMKAVVEVN